MSGKGNNKNSAIDYWIERGSVDDDREALRVLRMLCECNGDVGVLTKIASSVGLSLLETALSSLEFVNNSDHFAELIRFMDVFLESKNSGLFKELKDAIFGKMFNMLYLIRSLRDLIENSMMTGKQQATVAWFIIQVQKRTSLEGIGTTDEITSHVVYIAHHLISSDAHAFRELYTIFYTQLTKLNARHMEIVAQELLPIDGDEDAIGKEPANTLQELKVSMRQHDNDFPMDFRKVSIIPTVDELNTLNCRLQLLANVRSRSTSGNAAMLLDRQFRLLREDMLAPMREELGALLPTNTGKQQTRVFKFMDPIAVRVEFNKRSSKFYVSVEFEMPDALVERIAKNCKSQQDVKNFFENESGKKIFPMDSILLFISDNKVMHIGTVSHRDAKELAFNPAPYKGKKGDKKPSPPCVSIGVTFFGESLDRVLTSLCDTQKNYFKGNYRFISQFVIQTRSSFFSHLPVLKCLQDMTFVPMERELLGEIPRVVPVLNNYQLPDNVRDAIGEDEEQLASVDAAMRQRISIIQGPPGTGKTYVGVQIVKALLATKTDNNPVRILCLCYTNHALDSFLKALINAGVPKETFIRLGSSPKMDDEFTDRTLKELPRDGHGKAEKAVWAVCKSRQAELEENVAFLSKRLSESYFGVKSWDYVRKYLQDSADKYARSYVQQLTVPRSQLFDREGRNIVTKVNESTAWFLWLTGKKRPDYIAESIPNIWALNGEERKAMLEIWRKNSVSDRVHELRQCYKEMDDISARLSAMWDDGSLTTMQSANILGCTTTTAAKLHQLIEGAQPTVLLVEEAAEILEAHILTNICSSIKQIVMIGDHLQLRPKLECYMLTKDSRQGVDFDVSLFERLVVNKYPHSTLAEQHRMRPEISCYVRSMTYPNLEDSAEVFDRPDICGVQNNIAFIAHHELESSSDGITTAESCSKTNDFEVGMTVAIVNYFLQQKYTCDDIVILTPYLGQLMKIKKALSEKKINAGLGDLDKRDIKQFAAMGRLAADSDDEDDQPQTKAATRTIRVATIDNYQGEEANIIVASMVRSNNTGDIGFVSGAERINVLFSRARDGFYVLGNATTLMQCKNVKGKKMWNKLLSLMESDGSLLPGLPVRCTRHPTQENYLCSVQDFEASAKHGGCSLPCDARMSGCPNKHRCTEVCHGHHIPCFNSASVRCKEGLHDVSCVCSGGSLICKEIIDNRRCPKGHPFNKFPCHKLRSPRECKKCADQLIKDEAEAKRLAEEREVAKDKEAAARRQLEHEQELRQKEEDRLKAVKELLDAETERVRLELERVELQRNLDSQKEKCPLCMEQLYRRAGTCCSDNHFVCWECLEGYSTAALAEDAIGRSVNGDDDLMCPSVGCTVTIPLQNCSSVLGEPVLLNIMKLKMNKFAKRVMGVALEGQKREMEAEFRKILEIRNEAERAAFLIHKDIVDNVLTLKCPRCRLAFLDFSDCCAVNCTCKAGFCAWCLTDCGEDAHQHILHCPEVRGPDPVYPNKNDFEQQQAERKRRIIGERLSDKSAEVCES